MVLDHQELYSPLGAELRKKVRETLLKQHHHQNQKKLANRLPIVRSIADMGRRSSELHLDKNGERIRVVQLGVRITQPYLFIQFSSFVLKNLWV